MTPKPFAGFLAPVAFCMEAERWVGYVLLKSSPAFFGYLLEAVPYPPLFMMAKFEYFY